ncbi:MBL fold metallo-hydrolase [Flavobacterium sp.]|uniref:MBL fold metallo-hydrolase n=1 Tax=Flavobacterium sp. TaxID=239 RepID=UPI0022BAFED9|nr:MBL fold metallo-hydrolase [Flavobacterium sp.]MCZ8229489.1 MBL fold metallo-hydrolase [Flavobacterium sp.]
MNYKVEVISNSIFATNSYLIIDHQKNALLVDPSFDPKAIESRIAILGLKVVGILVTHAHQDHIFSVKYFMDLFGVPVWASEKSKELFSDRVRNLSFIGSEHFGLKETILDIPVKILEDNRTYQIENFIFKTGIYPGHSIGCTIFDFGEMMLTGDFIFKGTIGRIDWPGSNPEDMKNSLLLFKERYKAIDMTIYAGHNDVTTIQIELATNIFLLDPSNVKLL